MTADNRTLEEQLAHCDGKDCTCAAYGPSECACDADWTPAEVYRLRAAARGQWQPIETAPSDGSRILCAARSVFIGRHVDDSALWLDDNGAFRDPSHWQPLPEPPDD